MKNLNFFDWASIVLLVVGGLNWGIIGLFNINVVGTIFGNDLGLIPRIIYVLVGIAAIYLGLIATNLVKQEK